MEYRHDVTTTTAIRSLQCLTMGAQVYFEDKRPCRIVLKSCSSFNSSGYVFPSIVYNHYVMFLLFLCLLPLRHLYPVIFLMGPQSSLHQFFPPFCSFLQEPCKADEAENV